jgi:hypothetical protein
MWQVGWLCGNKSLLFLLNCYSGSKFITYKTGMCYVVVIIWHRGIVVSMSTLYTIGVGDKGYSLTSKIEKKC